MTDKFFIEKDAIRSLADILVETDLTEIEYENEGHRIRVARNTSVTTAVAVAPSSMQPHNVTTSSKTEASQVKQNAENALKSPMVGTVYVASEPGTPPFVKIGDSITQGQTLLIIEAMKVMNPIKAPRSGKISSILIKDGQPVEFGEPLLIID